MGTYLAPRITADIFLGATILFGPWWLACIAGFLFSLLFRRYFEVLFAGVVLDLLYNTPFGTSIFWNRFLASEIAIIFFLLARVVQSRVSSFR